MADETWYAWTVIHLSEVEVDKDSKSIISRETVKPGEKVTQDMFPERGEFDRLKSIGVIRKQSYPETRQGESPKQAIRRQYREQMEDLESGYNTEVSAISEPAPDAAEEPQSGQEIQPAV